MSGTSGSSNEDLFIQMNLLLLFSARDGITGYGKTIAPEAEQNKNVRLGQSSMWRQHQSFGSSLHHEHIAEK